MDSLVHGTLQDPHKRSVQALGLHFQSLTLPEVHVVAHHFPVQDVVEDEEGAAEEDRAASGHERKH